MTYHQQIPRDRRKNLEWRISLSEKCRDQNFRKEVLLACKEDPLFYINAFCHIHEPRTGAILPWCTWPFQDRAITKIVGFILGIIRRERPPNSLIAEKSRDMGATWMFCVLLKWLCDFHPNLKFLFVSYMEEMVWNPGNEDALFSKIQFLKENEPNWLAPHSFFKERLYKNPVTGSGINGYATTDRTAIGGRYSAVLVDELSRIREDTKLYSGTQATSNCRLFNYTPFGTANVAYKLSQMAKAGQIESVRMHWTEHPDKCQGLFRVNKDTGIVEMLELQPDGTVQVIGNLPGGETPASFTPLFAADYLFDNPRIPRGKIRSPWYDIACKELAYNKAEIAQMIDIDYEGSNYGFFDIQPTIEELIQEYARPPMVRGEIIFDPETLEIREFHPSENGTIKLWCPLDVRNRPPLDRRYVFGADISMGIGETNSVLSGIDCRTGEKVVSVATPFMSPDKFADLCVAICRWFTIPGCPNPKLIWEKPGPGAVFGKQVRARGFSTVYYQKNEQSDSQKTTDTPGWYPSEDNVQAVFTGYRSALAKREVINRDEEALKECRAIIVDNTGQIRHKRISRSDDPTGAAVNHGDHPTADALACKLFKDLGGAKPDDRPMGPPPPNSIAGRRAEQERKLAERAGAWE